MAGVLVEQAVEARHGNRCGPRCRVLRRIADREPVVEGPVVGPREALLDHGGLAAPEDGQGAAVDGDEVGRLDDQRVALPAAARVPQPLPNPSVRMRPPVERDDPGVVDHLDEDHDITRRLEDLVVVVVEAGHHRAGQPARDAPLVQVAVFRSGRLPAAIRLAPGAPLGLRRRQRGQSAVGRVDDQRCSRHPDAPLDPEVVVRPGLARPRVDAPLLPGHVARRVPSHSFLFRQELPSVQVGGPFQRGRRGVRPAPLQVRVAPRGTRRRGLARPRRAPRHLGENVNRCQNRERRHDQRRHQTSVGHPGLPASRLTASIRESP